MLHELLGLVLPATCAGCRSTGRPWCRACAEALVAAPAWTRPAPPPPGFPPTATAGEYDGVFRAALLAHKEHGRRAARPALAAALAAAVDLAAPGPVVVVPVPSSAAAVRARGGDPVGAMAAAAARRVGGACVPVLEQRRRLADQAGLDAAGRAANLAGAFGARSNRLPRLRDLVGSGCTVVIVDDVCTTGATLAEAARVLRAAGVITPVAAVVAATRKRHPVGTRSGGLRAGPGPTTLTG